MAKDVYQQSLEIKLELREIPFVPKAKLLMFYKGRQLKKENEPDLFVFGEIAAELKAVAQLDPDHEAQLFNYLRIARRTIGYLLNFGHKGELEWKRFVVSDLHTRTDTEHE